jgi:ankyrin repeat protein
MRQTLKHLPTDLDGAFEDVLDRIHSKVKEARDLAFAALGWVLFSARPLKTSELLEALSLEDGSSARDPENVVEESQVLTYCAGLVVVESADSTVHFAHYSIQEFLLKQAATLLPLNNTRLAKLCLTYLYFDVFGSGPVTSGDPQEFETVLEDYPFLSYAAGYWTHHVKGEGEDDTEILESMKRLFNSKTKWEAMIQIRYTRALSNNATRMNINSYPESTTILHIAARSGLTSVVSKLVNERHVLSLQDSYGRYPIHEACVGGYIETIGLLLKVSESNSISARRDHEGATPLHLAAEAGHTRAVEVLVEEGKADIFAQDSFGFTSLDRAIKSSEVESAQLLLRKSCQELGSQLHKKGHAGYTLLHQAAILGYVEGIELLLQASAGADIPEEWGNTPLNLAARHGHLDTVKLLGKATPVDFKCPEGGPLHVAAKYGRNDIVDVLLEESNINPRSRDCIGFTALHWAAIMGHVSVVEKLVRRTHLPLPGEASVPSPFHLASCRYFPQVQGVLLRHYETTLLIAPE